MKHTFFTVISLLILLIFAGLFPPAAHSVNSADRLEISNWPQLNFSHLKYSEAEITLANPKHNLVLVNRLRKLPADYEPQDLVIPDIPFLEEGDLPKNHLQPKAAEAIEELFFAAKEEGLVLAGVSGYRSYERQQEIFNQNVQQVGRQAAERFSAPPGASEHQTGLAIDISSSEVSYQLTQSLGETKSGQWIAENAHKFGFIIRYPKDKEHITGYQYEPWHLRYVGQPHAQIIYEKDITLEEYVYTNY